MSDLEVGCTWTLYTAPTLTPIDVDEAKQQARITDDASNALLESYIRVATGAAEDYLGRGLLTQTWRMVLDDFVDIIPLPMAAPLQSVTSVTYYDADGVSQTLATSVYDTDTISRPGRVVLKPSQSWPTLQSERRNGRVTITYVVGWTDKDSIPEQIRQGIRMYVAYLDLDRDGMEPQALAAKQAAERCWTDRVSWIPPMWC